MDTIRLFLQINLDIKLLKKSKFKWKRHITKKGLIFRCKYAGVRLAYYYHQFALTVETSATKFLYGDNSVNFNLNDLDKLFTELDIIVKITTKQKIKSVKKWSITRLDLVNNFYCANKNDKMVYLDILNRLSFRYCKNYNVKIYDSSVHAHNKSITYNFYSKSHENTACNERILRLEIQYKNPSLNRLKNNKNLESKIFEEIVNDIKSLNNIFKDNLVKLGLDKKFVTKKHLSYFFKEISIQRPNKKRVYKNMYAYFINQNNTVSNSTLRNYKKILAEYNYSRDYL